MDESDTRVDNDWKPLPWVDPITRARYERKRRSRSIEWLARDRRDFRPVGRKESFAFRKAFDPVSWEPLLQLLAHRGFPDLWCTWIHTLLCSGKTYVLLNGVPEDWITCKHGLRQGDPFHPTSSLYLQTCYNR